MPQDSRSGRGSRLRELSRSLVLHELAAAGGLSQSEIGRRTGLSRATIASIVAELREEGRVEIRRGGSGEGSTGGNGYDGGPGDTGGSGGAGDTAGSSGGPGSGGSGGRSRRGNGSGRGRPAALVRLAAESRTVVGVDFGHSHVAVAVADLNGTVLAERREAMDVHNNADLSLDRAAEIITALIAEVDAGDPPAMVAVGVPGPVALDPDESGADDGPVPMGAYGSLPPVGFPGQLGSDGAFGGSTHGDGGGAPRSGRVCAGTVLPTWAGYDPAAEIARRTSLTVMAENDASLGALGEHRFGVGRGIENLVFVKVSSGIGTGLILNGRLYRGSRGASGEIGHVQVRDDGALCRCGSRGCLETVSSADAALALLAPAHGRTMTIADLSALEEAGDPGVIRLLSDMGDAIGKVITVVAANLDPGLVIMGGSMARKALVDSVGSAIDRYTQPYVASEMTVVAASLGERASLMGAVALAIQQAAIY